LFNSDRFSQNQKIIEIEKKKKKKKKERRKPGFFPVRPVKMEWNSSSLRGPRDNRA
jgi:hypothetical protein